MPSSTRRQMLVVMGQGLFLTSLVGGAPSCSFLEEPLPEVDWSKFSDDVIYDQKGQAKAHKLTGSGQVDGVEIKEGDSIQANQVITLTAGSVLLLLLPDGSILHLKGQAQARLVLDSQGGGVIHLEKGGLLGVMRRMKKYPYLVKNGTAVIGIKGTVFFRQVLSPTEYQDKRVPGQAQDYFCVCNGEIEYLMNQKKLMTDRSVHHSAYFLERQGDQVKFKRAKFLLNHSDQLIKSVILEQPEPRHRAEWLNTYMVGDQYEY